MPDSGSAGKETPSSSEQGKEGWGSGGASSAAGAGDKGINNGERGADRETSGTGNFDKSVSGCWHCWKVGACLLPTWKVGACLLKGVPEAGPAPITPAAPCKQYLG